MNQTSFQKKYYDRGEYSACAPYAARKTEILTNQSPIQGLHGLKILDVGCYQGDALSVLSSKGASVIGVDISTNSLNVALSLGFPVVVADFSHTLPFINGCFDVVYCSEVIEHILDTDFFIRELVRILKPNGYLFITTPNICALKNRFRVFMGKYPYNLEYKTGGAGHIHLYNLSVLNEQLKDHGLSIVKVEGINLIPWRLCKKYRIIMSLNRWLSRSFPGLCLNIASLSQKNLL